MYTAKIGKRILERWRQRENRPEVTARVFFDEVFYPLFFDDERYLMVANNSKFDQAYKQKKKKPLSDKATREEVLEDFHLAVEELTSHEGHVYMGGYTRNVEDPTASQISSVTIPLESETTYLTWFGAAAGIGVKGGLSLLIDDDELLDQIVEGWSVYRDYMSTESTLKPHQIDTWNGWWLYIRNDEYFKKESPLINRPHDMTTLKDGVSAINTVSWGRLLFRLTKITNESTFLSYIYSFGQTNTTIGFIPILLKDITYLADVHTQLYGIESRNEKFMRLYETEYGFLTACKMGAIGLRALEPKDLKNYISTYGGKINRPKLTTDQDQINFQFYKTWIAAMLDNRTLLLRAKNLAEQLNEISPSARGKKGISNKIDKVLEANTLKQLADAFTALLQDEDILIRKDLDTDVLQTVIAETLSLPASKVPLFLTLLRFESAVLNYKK